MSLVGVAIAPHPPILIPEIGRGEEQRAKDTLEGMKKMAGFVAGLEPDVIIVISPHGNGFSDVFCILDADELEGDFSDFGYSGFRMSKKIDAAYLEKLQAALKQTDLPYVFMDQGKADFYGGRMFLDHGALVPLYFIEKEYSDFHIVHITPGNLSLEETHRFGSLLGSVAGEMDARVLILASADLSHCLKDSGPYSYAKEGPIFDQILVESIRAKRYKDILDMKPHLYEPAGQCGLRSVVMSLGSLQDLKNQPKVFSYEGPYGVGYMTAAISLSADNAQAEKKSDPQGADPYVELARQSIAHWVSEGTVLDWKKYKEGLGADGEGFIRDVEDMKAGAFVSIHKKGELRGCIGTVEATKENLALEIIHNAVEASSFDPRFAAVEPWELEELDIKVDVLKKPEPVVDLDELDPVRYGVIVEKGPRRGLLLPNLEGVDTYQEQIDIAMHKAGIRSPDGVALYRFEVVRHEE